MEIINAFFSEIDFYLIVLFRLTGFMLVSAFWGSKEIPNMLKVAFALLLTFMIIMTGRIENATLPNNLAAFVVVCMIETIKGLLIGFISNIFFSAFVTTGQIIDSMIGFRMGGILDPNFGVQMPQSARLLNIAAMVVFLQLNGHLYMIQSLVDSFKSSQIGTLISIESLVGIFTAAFSFAYLGAVRVAIPVILIFFLTNIVLGIMIKFVPQLNIFVVGIPLKIVLGIYSFIFLVQPFIEYLDTFFGSMFSLVTNLFI